MAETEDILKVLESTLTDEEAKPNVLAGTLVVEATMVRESDGKIVDRPGKETGDKLREVDSRIIEIDPNGADDRLGVVTEFTEREVVGREEIGVVIELSPADTHVLVEEGCPKMEGSDGRSVVADDGILVVAIGRLPNVDEDRAPKPESDITPILGDDRVPELENDGGP